MFAAHYIRMLRTWLRYRDAARALSRLTDPELRDIGVNRSEIDGIAWRVARSPRAKHASALRGD